jgi:hypothetical protein
MKNRATSVLTSAATGLTTALAGARWWTVLLVVVIILVLTYGVVCWLATYSKANRITTLLLTWEREPEPSKRQDSG